VPTKTDALRQLINAWLDDEVRCKPEEERTRRDGMLLETGASFCDLLLRHKNAKGDEPRSASDVSGMLSSYRLLARGVAATEE